MLKLKITPALLMMILILSCNNGEKQNTQEPASSVDPAKDSVSSTNLPDTMYDNVNHDSLQ